MLKLLTSINLFQLPFFLKVKHFAKVSTNFGIFLSIGIYSILIVALTECDVFYRQSPKIIPTLKVLSERPYIFSSNKFLSVSITDGSGLAFNDPSYFSISIENIVLRTKEDGTSYENVGSVSKGLHLCTENDTRTPQDYYDLAIVNYYCLDNGNFSLKGSFVEKEMMYFSISLNFCKNTTENNNSCKSYEKMTAELNGKAFNIIYVDNYVMPSDYSQPFHSKYQIISQRISPRISKISTTYLQKVIVDTNDGVIFSHKSSEYDFQTDSKEFDILYNEDLNNTQSLVTLQFFSSDKVIIIERTYQSLSEAIAIVGGLYSVFFVVGKQLASFNSKLYLTKAIMNDLYIFPKEDKITFNETNLKEQKDEVSKNVMNIEMMKPQQENLLIESPDIITNRNSLIIKPTESTSKKIEPKVLRDDIILMEEFPNSQKIVENEKEVKENKLSSIVERIKKKNLFDLQRKKKNSMTNLEKWEEFKKVTEKRDHFDFSIFEYFKLKAKKLFKMNLTDKEKLYKKVQRVFNDEIDIVVILKKLQDLEKLKFILLSKIQISSFRFLEKPSIILNEAANSDQFFSSYSQEITEVELKEVYNYYRDLSKKEQVNEMDKKLLKLLDKRIHEFSKI